jgi:hypothetical protein
VRVDLGTDSLFIKFGHRCCTDVVAASCCYSQFHIADASICIDAEINCL